MDAQTEAIKTVLRNQLKDLEDMVGRTVEGCAQSGSELYLKFGAGAYIILISEWYGDYSELGVQQEVCVNDLKYLEALGLLIEEEVRAEKLEQDRVQQERREKAEYEQYLYLKRRYEGRKPTVGAPFPTVLFSRLKAKYEDEGKV